MKAQDFTQLSQFAENMTAWDAAMKGKFAVEIAALKAEADRLQSFRDLDSERAQLKTDQDSFDAHVAKTSADLDARQKSLDGREVELNQKEIDLIQRDKDTAQRGTDVALATSQLGVDRAAFMQWQQAQNEDIARKNAMVEDRLSGVAKREAAVTEREENVRRALEMAGSLVK